MRTPGPLATKTYAAILTHKQRDVLSDLVDDYGKPRWRTARDVSETLKDFYDFDMHDDGQPKYLDISPSGAVGCLIGLKRRGYVIDSWDTGRRIWTITKAGLAAERAL